VEVQPTEKQLKHFDPKPEGSAIGLRSSGTYSDNDNIAASTIAGDLTRSQSYNGVTCEDPVENRRVQSYHGVPSRRNSTSRPLDIADVTYGDDPQASRGFGALAHAFSKASPTEAEMGGHPRDNLHALLSIAHELPVTLNTRLPSLISQQRTQEGVLNGSNVHGAGVHAGADTESEASMEAVAEPENAYDVDDDEAENSEGIRRAA